MRSRRDCAQTREHAKLNEKGYILAGVMVLLAVFMILLSLAIPSIREDIQRDQELETIQRGKQYVRAVQLFYRRFHRYPANLDELDQTNGLHFLRRHYMCPLTRQNDWTPVHLGQNRAPLTMGFFGTVLNAGAAIPSSWEDEARNSILGTPPPSASKSFSEVPSPDEGAQAPEDMFAGGGPIIGVRPSKSMESILIYKTKSNYDEWEFVYDPTTDPLVPKWSLPVNPPNLGAPGMGPPAN